MQGNDRSRRGGATRREMMAAAGASALALTVGAGLSQRPTIATGVVFEDQDGHGIRKPGHRGIAGVMVSNGRDVVRTDADGRWRLPVTDGDSLFVIKPPHWTTPTGAGGRPEFSYLYQPEGSRRDVPYYHAGVAPTGDLPRSIDFALRRQEESRSFKALLVADTQPANDVELGYLRDDILAAVPEQGAAFAINHGDVVFDDLALYARYQQMIGATGIPWHHCPGNHDINWDGLDDRTSRETWKRVFGPRHYAFQHAEATFIVLDNVHYAGFDPLTRRAGRYSGRIGVEQLQFVRNVLAHLPREQLVVLSMHIPLRTYQDPEHPADNTVDCAALLAILADRPHTVSFAGHMHLTEHHYLGPAAHHHHVLAAASGGWWGGPLDRHGLPSADSPDGTPNGFHVLEVDGAHHATRFVPAAGKSQGRLRVVVSRPSRHPQHHGTCDRGSPIATDEVADCEIIANVFDGGPYTKVTCEIAGQTVPTPMKRTTMADPFVADLFARTPELQRPWIKAVSVSHIWKAPLFPSLEPGAHRLIVRAVDEYGQEISTNVMLEVAAHAKATAPA
jgi:hypothetical protein